MPIEQSPTFTDAAAAGGNKSTKPRILVVTAVEAERDAVLRGLTRSRPASVPRRRRRAQPRRWRVQL